MSETEPSAYDYSYAVTAVTSGAFGVGTNLSWDSYQRDIYNQLNETLQKQANLLHQRAGVTAAEANALIEQRNAILAESRSKLSPFGRLYSEILKPSDNLPTLEKLLKQKGSLEAVLESVGKTRAVVNRLSVSMKIAGNGTVVLQVAVSAVLIAMTPPGQRGKVAAGQAGALIGGTSFGWSGAWAGCATAVTFLSPSLTIPIVGEVTEGGACLMGGIITGFGFGLLGSSWGQKSGEDVFSYVTHLHWIQP
ncbi:MAG: hypothetical protein KGQ69_03875 [Rhodospirillales bacterium]|nr:hypothetical protein [Rhodospirillales bacterium]